jgi:ribonucleoside-diphosphate reductase alpha chain
VLAVYIDQSISTNTFYSPKHFPGGKVPGTLIAKNLMLAYKWGLKTLYYSLINKVGAKVSVTGTENVVVSNTIDPAEDDEDCLACKL